MDPIAITTATLAVVAHCAKGLDTIHKYCSAAQQAELNIRLLADEGTTIQTAVANCRILSRTPNGLPSSLADYEDVRIALKNCERIFDVSRHQPAVAESDSLSKWDVGAMVQGRGHAGAEKLKCSSIFITFWNTATMEIFQKRLANYLQFHFSWHVKELIEKMTVRREMDTGRLPTTLLDPQPRTLTPASPEPPVISGLRLTTTDEEWREGEVDKQTRELDASPLPSLFTRCPQGVMGALRPPGIGN